MKLVWCSDIHTDFLPFPEELGIYLAPVGDALVLSGDIANGSTLKQNLLAISSVYRKPIYFVLGNHDRWGGSFAEAASDVLEAEAEDPNLCWLRGKVVTLSEGVAITGEDGWYDASCGDAQDSSIIMRDWIAISDLAKDFNRTAWLFGYREELIATIRRLAAESAHRALSVLTEAAKEHSRVIFVTHVPPFEELAMKHGQIDNSEWRPWYCSTMMGDVLLNVADQFPGVTFQVLCGHTHSRAKCSPRPNLVCKAAQATYSVPDFEEVISI